MDKKYLNISANSQGRAFLSVLFQSAPTGIQQTMPIFLAGNATSLSLYFQTAAAPTLSTSIRAPSTFIQQGFPANQEHAQTGGKIKYNLPQEKMKVNPNRHTSKGFLFATFVPCTEGTIVSKRFALLNETGTREAFLGKIILKNHQKPIPALQTPILNKEM